MAKVNKKQAVKQQQGLPTLDAIMTHQGGDNVPATVQGQDGTQAPAALTEGEFVFSIPSIVALGQGDYDEGMAMLEQMHEELRVIGEQMITDMTGTGG